MMGPVKLRVSIFLSMVTVSKKTLLRMGSTATIKTDKTFRIGRRYYGAAVKRGGD